MFHVMLVLPVLIIIAVLVSLFLFSVFTLVASIIGGATTAVFIKSKSIKRLLFIGFCILSFTGIICFIPLIAMFANLSEIIFTLALVFGGICIGILAIAGIRYSSLVQNKIGRASLIVTFSLILTAAVSFVIIVLVFRGLLLSAL